MLSIIQTPNYNIDFRANQRLSYSVSSQARIITSAFEDINPRLQKLNLSEGDTNNAVKILKLLKKMVGIENVFNEGGVSFNLDGKIIDIISPEAYKLKIRESNPKEEKDFKYVEIQRGEIINTEGFDSKKDSVEGFLSSFFDKVDFTILQLRKLLRREDIFQIQEKITLKATLNPKDIQICENIKSLFYEVQGRIASIQNGTTRSKIKNAYPNAKPSNRGSYQLEFTNLGFDKTDYSINFITIAAGQKYMVIKRHKGEMKPEVIIVDPQYRVLKEKNLGKIYKLGGAAVYYSQWEIDSPQFSSKLKTLEQELIKYNEYLKKRIAEFNACKAQYSTSEIGQIDKQTLLLIKNLMKEFDGVKSKMLKIKDAPRKKAFKTKYNIDTRDGSPSLIFKDINDNGESLHLSFPTMTGVRCMKIIIEKTNGDIAKSLFVNEDKLVKFKATSLGRSKRKDTDSNYYTQEEIETSGLKELLQILQGRLKVIPKSF